MVRYFEAGKYSIRGYEKITGVVLAPEQRREVEQMWSDITSSNPLAFNGGVWTCRDYKENNGRVSIFAARTDYATATWGRRTEKDIRTMGTGILIFENDKVVLARRTKSVVSDPGKISFAVGGVLDTNTPMIRKDFVGMVMAQMDNEFEEELSVKQRTVIDLAGLGIGPGLKAEWCGACFVDNPVIKDRTEAVELLFIPRRNLVEFVGDNQNNLELSTK